MTKNPPTTWPPERASKDEVLARLIEVQDALQSAAEAMARRYGACEQVKQMLGALHLVRDDWVPTIQAETES